MNRIQMKEFLKAVYNTKKSGGDILKVIAKYEAEYRNVYFFNDFCAKYILTQEENLAMTADLVNAALLLTGGECITNPRIENPVISGGAIYRDIEEDIVLSRSRFNPKGEEIPGDRIGIEFQHEGGSFYNNRLVFYVSRHVGQMLKKGEFYTKMQRLNLISFQMFDYLPWEVSRQYRHTVRFMDDEHNIFSNFQTITVVEVNKFLAHADTDYAHDNSRLAQWLRAIDTLNRNADFSRFDEDETFARLQKWVRLSTFIPEAFIKAGEHMKDDVEIAAFLAAEKVRKEYEARIRELEAAKAGEHTKDDVEIAAFLAAEKVRKEYEARIRELEAAKAGEHTKDDVEKAAFLAAEKVRKEYEARIRELEAAKAGEHTKDDVEKAAFLAAEKVRKEYEAREAAHEAREAVLLARIKELEAIQKN